MPKTPRPKEHLERKFMELLNAMAISCDAYDRGFFGEAVRLATCLQIALYDGGQNESVLGQLGGKEKITFRNSAVPLNPANLLSEMPLVLMHVGRAAQQAYQPIFDKGPFGWVDGKPFEAWWNQPILKMQRGDVFTRSQLISRMRNQDGGAHLDHKLDEAYAHLTLNNGMGWTFVSGDTEIKVEYGPEYATMRQIAYEFLVTMEDYSLKPKEGGN